MDKRPLVIFGSAEIASLAKFYFDRDSGFNVIAFTVDDEYAKENTFEGLPLIPFSESTKKFPANTHAMHVALSYKRLNKLRQEKFEQCKKAGYKLASYICSKSVVWDDLQHGENCFILENQTIQPGVKLGDNVMLWSGNHIGHGTFIDDHTYLASHVVLSGHGKIGKRCFFGVNAAVRDFAEIGDDCFIAMGANVTQNMAANSVALGAQGTYLPPDDKRARVLIKKYFGE